MQETLSSKDLAQQCSRILQEKKAENLVILDLHDIETAPADYFVIAGAGSEIHARALGDAVKRNTKALVSRAPRIEGLDNAEWILIDFFDVVLHIMQPETRAFYKLERLWGDARTLHLSDEGQLVA